MKWLRWLWLVPILLVVLVATAPASLIGYSELQAENTSGTIWNGQTDVVVELPNGGVVQLQQVTWQLQALPLLWGEAQIAIDIPTSNYLHGQLWLTASRDHAKLNGTLAGALQPVIKQWQLPVPFTLAGNWDLQLKDYQVSDFKSGKFCDSLDSDFTTRNVELRLNQQWHALGDFQTRLHCNSNHGIELALDKNNHLGLEVFAAVNGVRAQPQLNVRGSIQPNVQTPRPVVDMLVFMGKPDREGRYHFVW